MLIKRIFISVAVTALTILTLASANASYFESEKDIITRQEWGATTEYLYTQYNTSDPVLIQLSDEFKEAYEDELTIVNEVYSDSTGRTYKWPLEYPTKVGKFIIHHTETTSNLNHPKQAIRDIYYYHSVTRGWGDIGYNYIIDPQGRVYEGRQGGEGVVGGHAGPGNIGSIGIAVLGSYDDPGEDLPQAALESLAKLIALKSKYHNINPEGYGSFRGAIRQNVIGHRDVMSTECPGDNIYDRLPLISKMAKSLMDSDRPKFVNDYDFIDKSETYYFEMDPADTKTITIEFENIGKKTWGEDTFLVVNKNPLHYGIVDFPDKEGVRLAEMQESSVKPGETGTFELKIRSGKESELIFLDLTIVADGEKKLSEYKVLPVKIKAPVYTYDLVSAEFPPEIMQQGEKHEGFIKLKNTSNITWTRIGTNKVYLRLNNKPAGYLQEDTVKKGETGTFKVVYEAPDDFGYSQGLFKVILKGGHRLEGENLTFSTLIQKNGNAGALVEQSAVTEFKTGSSYVFWAKIRNIGTTTWNKNDMSISYIKDPKIEIIDEHFTKSEIKPGEIVEIDITFKVPKTFSPSTEKPFLVVPKIKGKRFLQESILMYYSVQEKELSLREQQNITKSEVYAYDADNIKVSQTEIADDNGGDIRVRISFNEFPTITSNKSFEVKDSSGNSVASLSAGQEVDLTRVGTKYAFNSGDGVTKSDNPYQVVAQDDAYLEITNFNRTSSWNPNYNDNKFRGSLELRTVNNEYAVINELPLESYLRGLAEEPNGEAYEKIKAIMVAARSYAKFYMHYAEKFPGMPYHLNDDPASCQKYLGYGYEMRSPNISKAVEETEGEVVTYMNQLIKTPYFSSSTGTTKSAQEVWGWDAPYLVQVDDPYCVGGTQAGHGVGMSGCGSKGMAQNGKTYKEILEYYYTNTEVKALW
ncbi:SpoIID/LytB domain-containing protein [Candidatus Peregrinibacteria bacterium]|jgi:hypothetical protein|nr:SpoIID/LytB domain-containing protein [Candidatus Peregrinibacteria bacterium]MBT4148722.1 SpoIID/LytB domain-containing protein [Candidatus Peregrinibacteria bacterium]MBT4366213.1 SpoIID/LytB domain-containing protein [Candidatus Peregrinibacteria bacterium]MBT4456279.1 SpoIID/LytB domain-containing protein [Candidatus Peregrinibacteria bacterium]